MNHVGLWLSASGPGRQVAVKEAAAELLHQYRLRWPSTIPTQLHKLAFSVDARIVRVKDLTGYARLMPVPGGFRILISDKLTAGKYRTSVAHELAHTLFYSRETEIPTRLIAASDAEEHFCFDVARRLLAPEWQIEAAKLRETNDPAMMFDTLTIRFQLSKPVAARVILEDYRLAEGVAGRWSMRSGEWALDRGKAYASRALGPKERAGLRGIARAWLETGTVPKTDIALVVGQIDSSGESAFVLVIRSR